MRIVSPPPALSKPPASPHLQMRFAIFGSVIIFRFLLPAGLLALTGLSAGAAAAEPSPPAGAGYVGVVIAAETADLAAEVAGRLVAVEVRVGDRVRRGQELGRIEPLELPSQIAGAEAAVRLAESGVAQAETDLRLATERAARVEAVPDLFSAEERSRSAAARDSGEKALEAARARQAQAQSELDRLRGQSARRVLRAPSDGWVASRLLDPGALVEVGQPVVRVKRGDRYLLRFAVPPAEAGEWTSGRRIEWRPEGQDRAFQAVVARVAPQVDAPSQMVFVEADLDPRSPAAGLLRDGLVVRVVPFPAAGPSP